MGIGGKALRRAERTKRKPGEQFQCLTTMHEDLPESVREEPVMSHRNGNRKLFKIDH
jgi:hypothetical protein